MPQYSVGPGRCIEKDGKAFVYVSRPQYVSEPGPGANPYEADQFTHEIVRALNERGEMLGMLKEVVSRLALDTLEEGMSIESGYADLFVEMRALIAKAEAKPND